LIEEEKQKEKEIEENKRKLCITIDLTGKKIVNAKENVKETSKKPQEVSDFHFNSIFFLIFCSDLNRSKEKERTTSICKSLS
jgi:hypothetical protein